MKLLLAALCLAGMLLRPGVAGETASVPPLARFEADVCIYGGTSGGVIAAVQAARLGKRVSLLVEGRHLGGMSSGGIGHTDTGAIETIGGLAREFYRRVGAHYGLAERFRFEPGVAERVFGELLAEAGVTPFFEQRLIAVSVAGGKITQLRAAAGVFAAAQFIDATYEGEVMARARVPFTFGRESAAAYGESLAGVRRFPAFAEFPTRVDPYVIPGRVDSGLLGGLRRLLPVHLGTADRRMQAYNYRLCLTAVPANRRPITRPPGYSERQYSLLSRYLQTQQAAGRTLRLQDLFSFAALPAGKFDVNSHGPVSSDCPGLSDRYPLASPATRAILATQHRRSIQGLLYFLGHSAQVPLSIRTEMLRYGLAADEYPDSEGWPHQLYVRECRRLLADYVMVQSDCEGRRRAPDPIALGSYPMDCHPCSRVIEEGAVENEGEIWTPLARPYGISYRAIIPPSGSVTNLHVTFALSASHVAFSSIRMEPVFMITSQSAATAACLAIDLARPLQQLPYPALAARLRQDGQRLSWPPPPGDDSPQVVIVDNADPGATAIGAWTASTSVADFHGVDYLHHGNSGAGAKSFRFTPVITAEGDYDVYLHWPGGANRASRVPVDVQFTTGSRTFTVDQRPAERHWVRLGRGRLSPAQPGSVLLRTTGADGYVIADAVAWVPAVNTAAAAPAAAVAEFLPGDVPE